MIIIFTLFAILVYFLIIDDTPNVNKNDIAPVNENENDTVIENAYTYLVSPYGNVGMNKMTGSLFIDNSSPEIFKIVKNKNKIALQSNSTQQFLMINYTCLSNRVYDVIMKGANLENNATKLKLSKKKDYYYIKFYNDYYLCIDGNGNLYSSRDNPKVFYFKFKKIKH